MNASIQLLQQVLPSSVYLAAKIPPTHASAPILGTERVGSGTIVDASGLILTTNYVVLGATEISASLLDGTTCAAEVVARDLPTGLAVLRIAPRAVVPAATWSSATLAPGQDVFLLAAVGEQERRVGSGGVMSLARFDAIWEYSLPRAIVATAINPGLAGGALFDSLGRMRGVVSLDQAEIGRFTVAVPVENFLDHRDELLAAGRRTSRPRRAWIGFYCYEVRDQLIVAGVLPGTPAEHGGLKPGDVLVAIDQIPVTCREVLYDTLWSRRPGEMLRCTVSRDDQVHDLRVCAGDAEDFFA